jgi:hypothetical protein
MPSFSISWNGGRNGWASFLIGFGWMPSKHDGWGLHIYLGLWVLTIQKSS